MALAPPIVTQSFAAGMVRVAPHLIPSAGAWRMQNLLLDEDGSAYGRRGTTLKSTAAFGVSGLRALWDGFLAGGKRTLFANATAFGVLDVDDVTPVNVGGAGLSAPARPAVMDGIAFIGGQAYGGSRKSAAYSTGTIGLTVDSTAVVGSGTAWLANVDPGMLLVIDNRVHAVAAVIDNTHLELAKPFKGATASGLSYSLDRVVALPGTYQPGGVFAVAGNRLLAALGRTLYASQIGDSTSWQNDDGIPNELELPDGVEITGLEALGDAAVLFTTAGVWVASNLAFDPVDASGNPQWRLERVGRDMTLLSHEGIATWQGALIVPALDGVWLMSLGGAPTLLTRSIGPLWAEYVRLGYRTGVAAVYRSHYVVPILDGTGSQVIDVLVCRLDRPTRAYMQNGAPLDVFPWTNFSGSACEVSAVAVRVSSSGSRAPVLLGAERRAAGRVIVFAAFKPDGPAVDHDGNAPVAELVTRDMATGGTALNRNLAKYLRLRYELLGAGEIDAAYATEARPAGTTWGHFKWGEANWMGEDAAGWVALLAHAPASDGDVPFKWTIAKTVRYLRVRLRCDDAVTRLVLRSHELFVRPSGRM